MSMQALFRKSSVPWREWAIFIVIASMAYGSSIHSEYVLLDDQSLILDNATTYQLSANNVFKAFTTFDPELYIPVTLLSYQIENSLSYANAWLMHAVNLAIHLLSSLLVASVLRLLGSRNIVAALLGLLFLVHPQNAEAVLWASARKDLLAAFFCLLSFRTYLLWRAENVEKQRLWSFVYFCLALLSKVSVALLPFVLLLSDRANGRPMTRKFWRQTLWYWTASAIIIAIGLVGKLGVVSSLNPLERVILLPKGILMSLQKLIFPVRLSVFYPHIGEISFTDPVIIGSAIISILMLSILYRLRKNATLMLSATWMAVFLLPSLLNAERAGEILITSDRYMYLSSVGAYMLLAHLLSRIDTRQMKMIVASLAVVISCGALGTTKYAKVWASSTTLFSHVISIYPDSYSGHANLGLAALADGDAVSALTSFQKAVKIRPTVDMRLNEAIALRELQRLDEAQGAFAAIAVDAPTSADALAGIASIFVLKGDIPAAKAQYAEALAIDSSSVLALVNLSSLLLAEKQWSEATTLLRPTNKEPAEHPDIYYNLAVAYNESGQRRLAREAFAHVVSLRPTDEDARAQLLSLQ